MIEKNNRLIVPVELRFDNVKPDTNVVVQIDPAMGGAWSIGKKAHDSSGFNFFMEDNQPLIIKEISLSQSTLSILTSSAGGAQGSGEFEVSLFLEIDERRNFFRGHMVLHEEASLRYRINNGESGIWEHGVIDSYIEL